jgi:hypothetical protein
MICTDLSAIALNLHSGWITAFKWIRVTFPRNQRMNPHFERARSLPSNLYPPTGFLPCSR